jgi:alkylation response protein AidB-like acyl-CoA dehydrogenase
MDFTATERQLAAAEAYASTSELPNLPVPEDLGGAGLTVTELAALLTEAGRHADASVAPLMTAALPLARWGDRTLLAGRPALAAASSQRGWARLTGTAIDGVRPGVACAAQAGYLLVPADDAVAVVAADAPGVTITPTPTSSLPDDNSKKPAGEATIRLEGAPVVEVFAGQAAELDRLATLAACCLIDGALQAALDLTAKYIATRHQFGRPLAEFQAVTQQIADIAIGSRTLHVITLSAAWQLETGADGDDVEVAGYWAAEGARRVVMKCHHLHGGMGMDVSYPMHRFSSLVADQVRALGGAEFRLERVACSST